MRPRQPGGVFQLGFAEWAAKEPRLLGIPIENETSPFPGLSLQRTDRGLLLWTNVDGDVYIFEDVVSGGRYGNGENGGRFVVQDPDQPGLSGPTFTGVPSISKVDSGDSNSIRKAP